MGFSSPPSSSVSGGIVLAAVFIITVFLIFIGFPAQSIFLLLFATIIFVVSFLNTYVALVIVVFSMLLSPEIGAGGIPGRAVVIRAEDVFLFVMFFGWLAKMAVNKELGFMRATALNAPVTIYICACLVSTLWGVLNGFTTYKSAVFYLLKYLEYFLLYFMVVNNLRSMKEARQFVSLLLVVCFLVCLYAWHQIPSGERISAPFEGKEGEPNTFAGYLLLMLSLIAGRLFYNNSSTQRFVLAGLFGLAIVPFVYTLSRGGWLAFFPSFLTFIILQKRMRAQLIAVMIILVFILPHVVPKRVHERVQETFVADKSYKVMGKKVNLAESAAARLDSWKTGLTTWLSSPILGKGIPVSAVIDNQYTRVLSETGIVGFIAFLWMLATLFQVGLKAFYLDGAGIFTRGVSLGFLAGMVGILAHSVTAADFIVVRIMEPFWFLAGIVTILPELEKTNE